MKSKKTLPVLITTNKDLRGVFFAYINPEDVDKEIIEVENVQMCVYWSVETRGVLGLAADGPAKGSRVTKPAPRGVIRGITLVAECSKEAVKAWKACPWS
jgi:hypothetical protein